MQDCLFCKIVNKQIPSKFVLEDDRAFAFRDINPQAPTHVLIVPKKHIAALDEATEEDRQILGHLLLLARQIARDENIVPGYRVVVNNGAGAGQSVFHIHVHVLGGRTFTWPPG